MANEIDGFKIAEDTDIQTINLDLDSTMNIDNDSLGIELLADPKKTVKLDGYGSGDEKVVSPKKEEFNLLNNINSSSEQFFNPARDCSF